MIKELLLQEDCNVPKALLSLILLVGTVLIGCEIYNFRYSPYLTAAKRTLLADYALPVAVLLMAFAGSWLFKKVEMGTFDDENPTSFQYTAWGDVSVGMILGSMGLGLLQSLLIFMDQNIAANIVNNPSNRLVFLNSQRKLKFYKRLLFKSCFFKIVDTYLHHH